MCCTKSRKTLLVILNGILSSNYPVFRSVWGPPSLLPWKPSSELHWATFELLVEAAAECMWFKQKPKQTPGRSFNLYVGLQVCSYLRGGRVWHTLHPQKRDYLKHKQTPFRGSTGNQSPISTDQVSGHMTERAARGSKRTSNRTGRLEGVIFTWHSSSPPAVDLAPLPPTSWNVKQWMKQLQHLETALCRVWIQWTTSNSS